MSENEFRAYTRQVEKAWKPYWQKWRKTRPIRIKQRAYKGVSVKTYARMWHEGFLLPPDELAAELNKLLGWVLADNTMLFEWEKPEGQFVYRVRSEDEQKKLPEPPEVKGVKLIVRIPFEFKFEHNFDTLEKVFYVRGRFGAWRASPP